MLVLLPPSEGKTAPPGGAPVALATLAHPELTPQREELLGRLAALAAGPQATGLAALGIGPGLAGELDRGRHLRTAPAAPAAAVYTGVLFQHLALDSLPPGARQRASERMLVASALWGVLRLEDRIPAYRLGMGARLPGLGGLAAWWRPALAAALPADGLVVDLRSQAYAVAWRPPGGTTVEVRAFTERRGTRTVVSHMAKATRGDVARILAERRAIPRTPAAVAATVERAGHRVELTAPARHGGAWALDVILAEQRSPPH